MNFSLRVVRFKARIGAGSLFLRLLYREPWFRVATLLILGIVLGVPILVLRTFPVTPRGVEPEIKISGLDWLQAGALARRAMKLSPEKDVSKHVASWRLAIGNNPGSLEINRAYLSLLSNNDIRGEYWSDAVRTGAWLLKLSRTNRLDLELTCLALEHYDLDDLIVELVESYTEERSMIVNQSYLRALFETRNADRFLSVWDSAQAGVREDQRLKLYRTALDLAFTSDDRFTDGQALIDEAKVSPDTEEIGHRLELFVSHSRRDVETFQESFRVLVEHFHDSVFDHLAYWDLLWNTGHIDLARSEASSYLFVPKSQRQVVEVANAYCQLELHELAFKLLRNYAPYYGFSTARVYSESMILIQTAQWSRLRRLAIGIRLEEGVTEAFMAFSYYLEGKASLELERPVDANTAFRQISEFSLLESSLGLYVGSNLIDLGYPNEAFDVLWPERSRYRNDSAFWELVFQLANERKDASSLQIAAENLYRLRPNQIQHSVNLAAILISRRIQIETAISLSYDALVRNPNNPSIQINYGHALLLAHRYLDAMKILEGIDYRLLNTTDRQAFSFALLELRHRMGDVNGAKTIAKRIIPQLLLPGDKKVYQTILESLGMASDQ